MHKFDLELVCLFARHSLHGRALARHDLHGPVLTECRTDSSLRRCSGRDSADYAQSSEDSDASEKSAESDDKVTQVARITTSCDFRQLRMRQDQSRVNCLVQKPGVDVLPNYDIFPGGDIVFVFENMWQNWSSKRLRLRLDMIEGMS